MGKEYIVYKKDLICDLCGERGAYDFLDDDMFICPECLGQSLIKSITKLKREIKNMYKKPKQRRNNYENPNKKIKNR